MANSSDVTAVVCDARLTPDAVRLILFVAGLGPGQHEVSHTQFLILLNHQGGDRRVRRALALATELGWMERSPGGRGHSDLYEFSPTSNGTPKNLALPNSGSLNPDSPTEFGQSKPDWGGDYRGGEVVRRERVGSSEPPPTPPTQDSEGRSGHESESEPDRLPEPKPGPKAQRVIDELAGRLNGCRGPMSDYLALRVPRDRQYGYAQTVATWLNGVDPTVFRRPCGSQVPEGERTGILAGAFNELLSADEALMKRPVGDPGNLKTKVGILILQRYSPRPAPSNPNSSRGPRSPSTDNPEPNPITGDKSRRRGGNRA